MTAFTAMDVQRCIVQFVTSDRLTRYVVINELVIRCLHTRAHTAEECFFVDEIIFRAYVDPFAIGISRTLSRSFSREKRRIRKLQKPDSLHLSVRFRTIGDRRGTDFFFFFFWKGRETLEEREVGEGSLGMQDEASPRPEFRMD